MIYSVIVSIGNTDNKLTQEQWSTFCASVQKSLLKYQTHFYGFPPGDKPWQNALWWVMIPAEEIDTVRGYLRANCRAFAQESIAFMVGATDFIGRDE